MKIIQWLAHSIEEYDQLRLLTALGHTVFSPGAYIKPRTPADDKRPPLDIDPVAPMVAIVDALGQPNHEPHGTCDGRDGHPDPVDACKRDTPDAMIEWADAIIVHHLEHTWLAPQWQRLRGKVRVIWRTVGQSGDRNEAMMRPLRLEGMQIIRYSPKERNIPHFAGEDTLIRFYKDPAEWHGWRGDKLVVTNATQHLYHRSLDDYGNLWPPKDGLQWTSYSYWEEATRDLPIRPMGPGSEAIGGIGAVTTEEMQEQFRACRAYVATGTQPASYVMNFIEAMMTGIPVVSIGPSWFRRLPYGPTMLEMHELAPLWADDPQDAHAYLERLLRDNEYAKDIGMESRALALEHFAMEKIAAQWADFLGAPVLQQELVAA